MIYVSNNVYGIDMSNARKFVAFREHPDLQRKG